MLTSNAKLWCCCLLWLTGLALLPVFWPATAAKLRPVLPRVTHDACQTITMWSHQNSSVQHMCVSDDAVQAAGSSLTTTMSLGYSVKAYGTYTFWLKLQCTRPVSCWLEEMPEGLRVLSLSSGTGPSLLHSVCKQVLASSTMPHPARNSLASTQVHLLQPCVFAHPA